MAADRIEIVDPDRRWPARFAAERERIKSALGDAQWLEIEHFGSTAVPGLPAKPIIDVLVAVPDLKAARDAFPERISDLGYIFWSDNPATDRLFFVKGMPPYGAKRTHHLHVCERPSAMWSRLDFRDYLRDHPDIAQDYAILKRDLAARHADDRDAYTDAKSQFIASVTKKISGIG